VDTDALAQGVFAGVAVDNDTIARSGFKDIDRCTLEMDGCGNGERSRRPTGIDDPTERTARFEDLKVRNDFGVEPSLIGFVPPERADETQLVTPEADDVCHRGQPSFEQADSVLSLRKGHGQK
jgi:hypothetical protein